MIGDRSRVYYGWVMLGLAAAAFSVWPRVYGRKHLGRIQGAAQAMTVLASAVGPLLLAWCVEVTGSYAAMFYLLAALIALTATSALATGLPERVEP